MKFRMFHGNGSLDRMSNYLRKSTELVLLKCVLESGRHPARGFGAPVLEILLEKIVYLDTCNMEHITKEYTHIIYIR